MTGSGLISAKLGYAVFLETVIKPAVKICRKSFDIVNMMGESAIGSHQGRCIIGLNSCVLFPRARQRSAPSVKLSDTNHTRWQLSGRALGSIVVQ